MKLANRSISRYVVHTAAEIHVFAENWGIAKEKIRSSGFYLRTDDDETGRASHPRKEHIFAGGTSFRDYEALLEAARLLPHRQFVIGSHQLHDHPRIPPNVEAGPVSRERFFELINTAAVVVVPLRTDVRRIIGMLTYLKAMWLRKPTIVSQALGVEEFIDDGENGLIVDGSPQSYATAIEWVLDPAHKTRVDTLCDRAHESVRTLHTVERHVARLLSVVDETARENRLLRGSRPPA